MKYLKLFENFTPSINRNFFIKIFDEYFSNMTIDEINNQREEMVNRLIDRAKVNLDKNPNTEKLNMWKSTIDSIIDNFLKKGNHKTDEEEKQELRENIRKENLKMLSKNSTIIKELEEVPDYYLQEVGLDTIVHFLKSEDRTSMFPFGEDFSKEITTHPEEDILDIINKNPKYKYAWETMKSKLRYYFIRRVGANVSRDELFSNEEEVIKWFKTYIQAFLYEYLIPFSKQS